MKKNTIARKLIKINGNISLDSFISGGFIYRPSCPVHI